MTGIIDYAYTEARSFADLPFNEIDALIISTLIYEDVANICPTLMLDETWSGSFAVRIRTFEPKHLLIWLKGIWHPELELVSFGEANHELHHPPEMHADDKPYEVQMVSAVNPDLTHDLLRAADENPRYANVRLGAVVEHINQGEQTQFAAAAFQLSDGHKRRKPAYKGTLVISFRGTDDSLIGWKEDFNMAFQYPVSAQRPASAYLDTTARLWKGPIILVGHSKGGNLTIYAAMNADSKVRKRIQHVYSLDSPGFPSETVTSPAYRTIQPKVTRIVPSSSIVGMIFETPEPCRMVSSDSDGIMQYSAFTWLLDGDQFITEPDLSSSSQLFNEELNHWIATLTPEQRERAVDALFTVLHANGATSFNEVISNFPASIPAMLGTYVGLTSTDRRHLVETLAILFKTSTTKHKPTPIPASAPSSATSKVIAEIPAETAAGVDSAAPARTGTDADAGTTALPSAEDVTEIVDQLTDMSANNSYTAQ